MVDPVSGGSHLDGELDRSRSPLFSHIRRVQVQIHCHRKTVALVATLLIVVGWGVSSSGGDPTARASTPPAGVAAVLRFDAVPARHTDATTTSVVPPIATTTSTTTATAPVKALPVVVAPVVVPLVAPAVAGPSVAELVAEVEAAGIDPGSNWSWSMGDSATHCGAMTGAGTGCTYGANDLEFSVFSGSPTLALVAHELANAETQNDAVPDLLSEVSAAEAGTSWSPTDAVASCLVAHFMGFQDQSAGTWQCPAALAANVVANIHDSL